MYECPRCHYQTIKKNDLKCHFHRKKICLPLYENIPQSLLQKRVIKRNAFKVEDKDDINIEQNDTNITQKSHKDTSQQIVLEKYQCKYCLKILSRTSSLNRHFLTCKEKVIKEQEKEKEDEKELKLKRYEEQLKILQDEIKKIKEQKCYGKVTNNYYNTQNIQNQQNIKNEIKINAFREEKTDYLTPEYIMGIAKRGMYYAIPKLIEKIYFNENHPENQNVKITNERSKYAQIFDGKRFIKYAKNLIVRDMIRVSIDIIDEICCDVDMPIPYNQFSKKYNDGDRELMNSLYKKAEGIALTYSKN